MQKIRKLGNIFFKFDFFFRDDELEVLEKLINYFETQVVTNVEAVDDSVYNDSLGFWAWRII